MSADDLYEAWKQKRAETTVSEDFADKVMQSIYAQQRESELLARLFAALTSSRMGRVGLCAFVCAACLFRILQLFTIFLFPS